jgi:hypothetical protein
MPLMSCSWCSAMNLTRRGVSLGWGRATPAGPPTACGTQVGPALSRSEVTGRVTCRCRHNANAELVTCRWALSSAGLCKGGTGCDCCCLMWAACSWAAVCLRLSMRHLCRRPAPLSLQPRRHRRHGGVCAGAGGGLLHAAAVGWNPRAVCLLALQGLRGAQQRRSCMPLFPPPPPSPLSARTAAWHAILAVCVPSPH